jgi:hypothetical protein
MNTLPVSKPTETCKATQGSEAGPLVWDSFIRPGKDQLQKIFPNRAVVEGMSRPETAGQNTREYSYEAKETQEAYETDGIYETDGTDGSYEIKEIKEAQEAQDPKEAKDTKGTQGTQQVTPVTEAVPSSNRRQVDKLSPDLLKRIDGAICRYRVRSYGDFNHPLFMVAQTLRSIEEELNIRVSTDVTVDVANRWQASNRDNLDNDLDYVAEFLGRLELVRFPKGALARAVEVARSIPPPNQTAVLSPKVQSLAKLCCVLQLQAGDEPFFLDGRSAGAVLDIPHSTVVIWFRGLCRLGLLKLISKGTRGEASRYRYTAEDEGKPESPSGSC